MHLLAGCLANGAWFEGLVNTRKEAFSLLERWYEGKVSTCGESLARARWIAGLPTEDGELDWWDCVEMDIESQCHRRDFDADLCWSYQD